jgi:hypothetical protein
MRSTAGDLSVFDESRRARRRPPGETVLKVLTVVVGGVALLGVWMLVSEGAGSESVEVRVVDPAGVPVAGAVVTGEAGGSATTDESGSAAIALGEPDRLTVTARGYRTVVVSVDGAPQQPPLALTIEPYVLRGRVTDPGGSGLAGAEVTVDSTSGVTDGSGTFEFHAIEPGTIVVTRAAWAPTEVAWTGDTDRVDIALQPLMIRAVRVHQQVAGSGFASLLTLIEGTVINALVFDTKIEDGHVVHDIDVPLAREAGAISASYDPVTVIGEAKSRGLYTITRVVAFQDPIVAARRTEWAIRDSGTGGVWRNHAGQPWLDPTNPESWEYPLALGVAACRLGFDEIQFDYVRFPSDGDVSTAAYAGGAMTPETRVAAIAAFLDEARQRIHAEGCAVSVDVFAIIATAGNDQGIGQRIEELSAVIDVLSPMIYPSHYGRGWGGFDDPNDHPSAVVTLALESGIPKMSGGAIMRPWLQAFFWNTAQVRESIEAAERLGVGWMLWNAVSAYDREWLPTE